MNRSLISRMASLLIVFAFALSGPEFAKSTSESEASSSSSNGIEVAGNKAQSQAGWSFDDQGDLPLRNASSDPNDIYWDDRFNLLGVSGAVLALAAGGGDLYAGGVFSSVGSVSANNIAKWDGTAWSMLGGGTSNGTDGTVLAVSVSGTDVYVGGSFSSAGGTAVNNIAKWDGSSWAALGSGIENGDVRAIVVSSGDVYVGGVFSTAGGQAANNVAKWNGSSWSTLGTGANNGLNGPVYALGANNGSLYVGGSFSTAGTQSAVNIAHWEPSTNSWSALGSGTNLDVNAIIVSGNDLYVGGLFATAGGVSARKIARWDGSSWFALGSGISGGDVNALAMMGTELFAAGSFTTAGSVSASQIAKWDGSNWSKLGSGIVGGFVFGIATIITDAYVGGSFSTAGAKSSNKFGLWSDPDSPVPVELVSFSAHTNASMVEIKWTTATEFNNFGFQLERMGALRSSTQWEKIAFIEGHGTTTRPQQYSYHDPIRELLGNGVLRLQYRLKQIDLDGSFEYHGSVEVVAGELPENIILGQNYPNPFNPETTIEFVVPEDGFSTLKVYNMRGQEVQSLVNRALEAGVVYRVKFDGGALASGLYYYVLRTANSSAMPKRTMLLLK